MREKFFIFLFLTLLCYWQTAAAKPVQITATSWLVANEHGKVLEGQNIGQQRSIASITKLMTAMVILDSGQDLDQQINGMTRLDLIQLMLIKSDNNAAEILCNNYPYGRSGCVSSMNHKAMLLGLTDTHYADPRGLNIMNVSTANDLIKLVMEASKYPVIVKASNTPQATIKNKKRTVVFNNTNPLVSSKNFIVSKTGYIRASGGCIVMMLDTDIGRRIVVLLNSKNTKTRIPEAEIVSRMY